jgi:iron complex transport system substrate-binding protein
VDQPSNLDEHILLWAHASLKVLDIRHIRMQAGDALRAYRCPAGVFLFALSGSAQIRLDRSGHARQVLDRYETKAKEARAKLQASMGSKSAVAIWHTKQNFYIVHEKMSSGDVLYHDLGFTVPAGIQELSSASKNNWIPLSLEKLAKLDADYIFLVNSNGTGASEELKKPLWQSIPAVQHGHVYEFGTDKSWLYTGTIANTRMIEDVLASVLK